MRRDIDEVLQNWPFEPSPGELLVREVRCRDGRSVLQVRVELGIMQMEVEGRPDGVKPHGFASFLDYMRHRAANRAGKGPSWMMKQEHCAEADREFIQYYHRRVAWLSLQKYERALIDSDHTLALMDFVQRHGGDEEYSTSHERFRGLVLLHRAQATAALALKRNKPEEAIDAIHEGIETLRTHKATLTDSDDDDTPHDQLVEQLIILENDIRKNFEVAKTLREQLDEAVDQEDYERAARLRDQIKARAQH